jgi:putative transposase
MTEVLSAHFRRHRFPAEIIAHAVWLYYRFPLSFRDVEDLLAERGIEVSKMSQRSAVISRDPAPVHIWM